MIKNNVILVVFFNLCLIFVYPSDVYGYNESDISKKNIAANKESKENITTIPLIVRNNISYLPNENKPFTGKHILRFLNGNKLNEENYINGKKSGLDILWDEYGRKMSETNYIDGNKNGLSISYDNNGNIISKINFKDGKIIEKPTSFDSNGRTQTVEDERNEQNKKLNNSSDKSTESIEMVTRTIIYKNDIAFIPDENEPFTGEYDTYYPNGNKKSITHLKYGKKMVYSFYGMKSDRKCLKQTITII